MSLPRAVKSIWIGAETKNLAYIHPFRPGAALLAAGGFAEMAMAAGKLPEEERSAYRALQRALRAWLGDVDGGRLRQIVDVEFDQCLALHGHSPRTKARDCALSCAYLQIRCVLPKVRDALPGLLYSDGYLDMDMPEMLELGKRSARLNKTSTKVVTLRLVRLEALALRPWSQQQVASDRMPWTRSFDDKPLEPRLRPAVLELAIGARWEWAQVHGTRMLRVRGDNTLTLRLSEEEESALQPFLAASSGPDAS